MLGMVTSKLEWMARRAPRGGDDGGGAWARGHDNDDATFKSGGGGERQAQVEYHHVLFLSMESILRGGGEGKGDGRDDNGGAGNDDIGSGRTGAGGIFGRVAPDLQTARQHTTPQAGVPSPRVWQWGMMFGDTPHPSGSAI